MEICDVCNASTSWKEGTAYTADEFRKLVSMGFEPDEISLSFATAFGIAATRAMAIAQWKQGLVTNTTTGWLLCPTCAARAAKYMPKPAGTGPDGYKLSEPWTPELFEVRSSQSNDVVYPDVVYPSAVAKYMPEPAGTGPGGYKLSEPRTPELFEVRSPQSNDVSYLSAVAMPQRTNGPAIASLILGIIGTLTVFLFIGLPISIVGLVLAVVGLRRVEGKGLAIAGLVLSIIGVILGSLVLLSLFRS